MDDPNVPVSNQETPARKRDASASAFVRREGELDVLWQALKQACEGGKLALVTGEAGIGKTSLARELTRKTGDRGMTLLVGGAYDLIATPFGPRVPRHKWALVPHCLLVQVENWPAAG